MPREADISRRKRTGLAIAAERPCPLYATISGIRSRSTVGDQPLPTRFLHGLAIPDAGAYELDPVHTFIYFSVQHLVVGRVRGRFSAFHGTVVVAEDPTQSAVNVVIATASIDTQNATRDEDLRSAGMLNVASFPAMTYAGRGVAAELGGRWTVDGELTVRDVTRVVPLRGRFLGAVQDGRGASRIAFQASAAMGRKEFGLTRELDKESGGLIVGRDILIEINAEAIAVDRPATV